MRQLSCALSIAMAAALLAAPADAEAKGRRSGSSSSSKPAPAAKPDVEKDKDGGGFTVNLRPGSSGSSSGGSGAQQPMGNGFVPFTTRPAAAAIPAAAPLTAEEEERRAQQLDAYEKAMAAKAAAQKAAAEQAEIERLAAEESLRKASQNRAALKAAQEKAEADRIAAAQEKKRREDAVAHADVDRVLQRAKDDYPVLKTPEGEPLLRMIMDRQQVLLARGMYPSVAMVEAVADHADALRPRPKQEAPVTQAAAPGAADQAKAFGGCRWVTPYVWSCK